MAVKCSNAKCARHHVRLRGQAKYCPVCGNSTIAIPLFPFYIYVPKRGLYWLSGALFASVLFVVGVVPVIQACNAQMQVENARREAAITELPEFWRTVYYSVRQEEWRSSRVKMVKTMLEKIDNVPRLSPENINVLIVLFNDQEKEFMEAVAEHVSY